MLIHVLTVKYLSVLFKGSMFAFSSLYFAPSCVALVTYMYTVLGWFLHDFASRPTFEQ